MEKQIQTIALASALLVGCCVSWLHSGEVRSVVERPTGELWVVLVGDTSSGENYQVQIEKDGGENILRTKGYDYGLKNFAPFLKQADLVVANLETPIPNSVSSPLQGKKPYVHWSDPRHASQALAKHNISAVSLANNHTLDYGTQGLEQSVGTLKKHDIQWFGAGKDELSAAQPLRFDYLLAGQPFRLVIAGGFEYRENYDKVYDVYAHGDRGGVNAWTPDRAAEQIRASRQSNPDAFIVAYPHFGKNYAWRTTEQKELAHALIDAGANLIIGHGAHMLQEVEQYRGRWIVYSLGNFVFNSPGRYQQKKVAPFSLVARLDITARKDKTITVSLRLYPIVSDNLITNYQPSFVSDKQFRRAQKLLLEHSSDKEQLQANMKTGEDEFGSYFVIDVSSGKEGEGQTREEREEAEVSVEVGPVQATQQELEKLAAEWDRTED